MPSRLLYVGLSDNLTCIRLVESLPKIQKYVALSHCWGDQSSICTTTKATFQDRAREIPWSSLSKTFQDAVSITRSLNISLLWIDSLCIIQDDAQDWQAESVKMAEVYSQAYLTISATGGSSGASGCLFPRWHETGLGQKILHSTSHFQSKLVSPSQNVNIRYSSQAHKQFQGDLYPPLSGAPLWERAWAFQERILSNRIIHFHGEEMIWECQETANCECGYLSWQNNLGGGNEDRDYAVVKSTFTRAHRGGTSQVEAFEIWLKIVMGLQN